jgi:hypothetical protein
MGDGLMDLVLVPSDRLGRANRSDHRFTGATFMVPDSPSKFEGFRFRDVWIHDHCNSLARFDECLYVIRLSADFSAHPTKIRWWR